MKLLLTGLPRSGKTTLIKEIVAKHNSDWIISTEVLGSNGNRLGFQAETSDGHVTVFAHKTHVQSGNKVGDFTVDIAEVDRIFTEGIARVISSKPHLFVLDEIGRMQMLSDKFATVLTSLFESDVNLLATIRHGDTWTERYINTNDAVLFTLTEENRNEILQCINSNLGALDCFEKLTSVQRKVAIKLARSYLQDDQYIQFNKLYQHAVRYIVEDRITQNSSRLFTVIGDHSKHEIESFPNSTYSCDCDLFNGKNNYKNLAGECSHVQALKLYLAPESSNPQSYQS